ncbi:MAG: YihY/virulence factor BrkB family protein, partial [Gemmatimonadaceae bacterium]|nr:YihY/virulence factor BrkB family protein [Gloeobacterales cyanobacterium ES-bin-141]
MPIFVRPLVDAVRLSLNYRLPNLAAEMAFSLMLSLLPAMLVLVTAVGLFGSSQDTFAWLMENLGRFAPKEVMDIIQMPVRDVAFSENGNLFSLGLVGALWAASGAISTAMEALDLTNNVPKERKRPFWLGRLIAVGLFLGTVLLVLAACFAIFIGGAVLTWLSDRLPYGTLLVQIWEWLQWPIALGLIASAFALLYRFGPAQRRPGTPLLPGALLSSVLWLGVSGLFKLYIANFGN